MVNLDIIPVGLFNVLSHLTLFSEPQRRFLLWNLDHEKSFRINRIIFKLKHNGIMSNIYFLKKRLTLGVGAWGSVVVKTLRYKSVELGIDSKR